MDGARTRWPLFALVALLLCGCGSSGAGPETTPTPTPTLPPGAVMYTLTFTGLWTAASHPADFPSGAHFSAPIGAAHRTADIVWAHDGTSLATPGVEQMAETGGRAGMQAEIAAYIASGDAAAEILGGGGISATGSTTASVIVAEPHTLISLTSMLAPSPDWFVGVRNVDLRAGGTWVERLTFDLDAVYDAGTDDGMTFASADSEAVPHLPIRLVADEGNHFLGTPVPIARIVIERVP